MTGSTILAVNAGSSSLKCALFEVSGETLSPLLELNLENPRGDTEGLVACLDEVLERVGTEDDLARLRGAGHRVVHGGDGFGGPVEVDDDVVAALQELVPLAPLHQPASLALIESLAERIPGIKQVACFDTAFHRQMPAVARNYALPSELTDAGIHGYGFHGLSYEFVYSALQSVDSQSAAKRIIIAHLGAGASLCAIQGGKSIATTMGFSTVEGMPMVTRSGSIDPGVLIHLMRAHEMSVDDIERLLYRESGLRAIAGLPGGVREFVESDDPQARAAIEYFTYRATREIGSLAAALGGLDVLVFTGGVGANSAAIRQDICQASDWLGVHIDDTANDTHQVLISSASSRVDVRVIPTSEERQIASHTKRLLSAGTSA